MLWLTTKSGIVERMAAAPTMGDVEHAPAADHNRPHRQPQVKSSNYRFRGGRYARSSCRLKDELCIATIEPIEQALGAVVSGWR